MQRERAWAAVVLPQISGNVPSPEGWYNYCKVSADGRASNVDICITLAYFVTHMSIFQFRICEALCMTSCQPVGTIPCIAILGTMIYSDIKCVCIYIISNDNDWFRALARHIRMDNLQLKSISWCSINIYDTSIILFDIGECELMILCINILQWFVPYKHLCYNYYERLLESLVNKLVIWFSSLCICSCFTTELTSAVCICSSTT